MGIEKKEPDGTEAVNGTLDEPMEYAVIEFLKSSDCRMRVRKAGVYRFVEGYKFRQHSHIEYEINHISAGQGTMLIEGKEVVIHQGQCVIIPPHKRHSFWVDKKSGCKLTQLEMSLENSQKGIGSWLDDREQQDFYIIKDCEDLIPLIERIARLHRKEENEYFNILLKISIVELILTLKYHMRQIDKMYSEKTKNKMKDVMQYLQEHFSEDLDLEEMAGAAGISSRYLRKYFKEVVGMSCIQYVTNLRMEKAKNLLWETNRSIITIAVESGYENAQYFSRVFKKAEGMTPKEYRMKWKEEGLQH